MADRHAAQLEEPLQKLVDYPWKALVGVGCVGLVVGALIMAWPDRTTQVAAVIFGIYLLVTGFGSLFLGLSAPMSGGARALTLISGALSVVLGVMCFRDELQSVVLLAIWIGAGWLIAGFSTLFSSTMPGVSTALRVLQGLVLLLAGGLLVAYPIESLTTLVWVTGVVMVALGAVDIVHGLSLRRALRRGGAQLRAAT